MKEICVFDKTLIYRPSFNDVLRASLYKATKDAPKDKKFRIIIEPVEKKKSDNEEFVITEKSTLREIAEHNPEMFERLMYAAFGPGWRDYFQLKATTIKEENNNGETENNYCI